MNLHRYELDSEKALNYICKSLKDANGLSDVLLEEIDLKTGSFFTLLPDGSNLDRLYEFESGVILPQNPRIVTCSKEGVSSSYSITPNIREKLSEIILEMLENRGNITCIFDDIIRSPRGHFKSSLNGCKYVHDDQLYYMQNKSNASVESIQTSLKASHAFWHSLGMLTKADLQPNVYELNQEMFRNICLHTQMFFVGAYDGEGYVFWEKSGSDLFVNQVSDKQWHQITIEDPTFVSGRSVFDLIKLLLSVLPMKYIALNDIEGSGKYGLIYSLQHKENSVLELNEDFLNSLCDVDCFEWGDFFLLQFAPEEWDIELPAFYPQVINNTDTTIRTIDNHYLYIYTPRQEVVDIIKKNYEIESYKMDSLDNLDYPY